LDDVFQLWQVVEVVLVAVVVFMVRVDDRSRRRIVEEVAQQDRRTPSTHVLTYLRGMVK
jgi:hypothetical protein